MAGTSQANNWVIVRRSINIHQQHSLNMVSKSLVSFFHTSHAFLHMLTHAIQGRSKGVSLRPRD
jgi:hypothetical protein